MSNLKFDHEYLYKRVRLKAILHIALGLILTLFPLDTTPQAGAISTVQVMVGRLLTLFGFFYLVIGIFIAIGLVKSKKNYQWARAAMTVACVYNTLWLALLLVICAQHLTRSIAYITALYGYLSYNLWYVRNDPGWGAIEFIKEVREEAENGRISPASK